MFVTPMISVYPSNFDRKQKQYSAARQLASRASSGSSEVSSLHRTSSTTSNGSTSRWSISSASSVDGDTAPKHRKSPSRVSFHLPRPLQPFHKKVLAQQSQTPSPPVSPRVVPPPRPPRPDEVVPRNSKPVTKARAPTPPSPPETKESEQWQCSDLVIRCKSDIYHVDRSIMCYHSRWVSHICAIMRTQKISKPIIDLSADDNDAVAAMMQYCYQLDYSDKSFDSENPFDSNPDPVPHVAIYMLAERCGMSGLERVALEKFKDEAIDVLHVSGDEELFLRAVRLLYDPQRRADANEMRRVAVEICADHVQGFIAGDRGTMASVFESMDSLPEFRNELFEEMGGRWK